MDRGIWATWYDIPEKDREEYLPWLHSVYLPQLVMRPGYLWAAHYEVVGGGGGKGGSDLYSPERNDGSDIGSGTEFIVLVGAATPHIFFNPSLAQLEKQQNNETREMLALRAGTRTCILTEEARVDGPEINRRPTGTTPGPVIQMGGFNMKTIDDELELAAWYAQDRLMAMAGMPGCIGARKMVSIAGWAKHSVLYEFISHEARDKEFLKGLEGKTPENQEWSVRVINSTIHGPGSPSIAQRIWPEE
jgi:hypothetical protein